MLTLLNSNKLTKESMSKQLTLNKPLNSNSSWKVRQWLKLPSLGMKSRRMFNSTLSLNNNNTNSNPQPSKPDGEPLNSLETPLTELTTDFKCFRSKERSMRSRCTKNKPIIRKTLMLWKDMSQLSIRTQALHLMKQQ